MSEQKKDFMRIQENKWGEKAVNCPSVQTLWSEGKPRRVCMLSKKECEFLKCMLVHWDII